jgi:DNA modification methylase
MKKITKSDYETYCSNHDFVEIENNKLPIGNSNKIKRIAPDSFSLETTSVWSFPDRGKWATHYLNAKYRGNWSPYIARNLILRYSKEGDTVLDAFLGSGTTLIECKVNRRKGIGVDINKDAAMLSWDRLQFDTLDNNIENEQKIFVGDARYLNEISEGSIDFIATHPPYANIIKYTKKTNANASDDLSSVPTLESFYNEMAIVAKELYRILKKDGYCAILIGDTRRKKHQIPISFNVLNLFLNNGFILKESIIKLQHNTSTEGMWRKQSEKYNFLLLAHEHLFIFRK